MSVTTAVAEAERAPRSRPLDPALLIAIVLLLWQAIGSWTQGVAVSAPLRTLIYAAELLTTGRF